MSKQESSKKMNDTVNDDAESIGRSAIVEASYDLNDDRSIASVRNHGNLLKNFKEESDSFCMIKGVLAALYVLTAIAVGTAAYEFSEKQDAADFEAKFNLYAAKIADFSVANTRQTFGRMELVGAEITSNRLNFNAVWPFFTQPYFEQSVKALVDITYADVVAFSPIVTSDKRMRWEQYSVDTSTVDIPISLYDDEGPIPTNVTGPFVPIWQLTPESTDGKIVNFDLQAFPSFSRGFQSLLQNRHSILSETTDIHSLAAFPGVDPSHDVDEPHSFLIHPVYDGFDENAEVVGTLTALLRLQYLFQDTLDSQTRRLITVLRDKCGVSHTYFINAGVSEYLGPNDLHDPVFDYLALSVPFTELLYDDSPSSFECGYTLDIYPSEEFQNDFITNYGWLYLGVVLAIFLILGSLLLFYDSTVNERQNHLMDQALRSRNILASLFPSSVHDRLFGRAGKRESAHDIAEQGRNHVGGIEGGDQPNASRSPARRRPSSASHEDEVVDGMYTTKPIADLFPNTTILFADIVGFTAWSSQRQPTDVFTLLETIFRSFDSIAQRMDVFKVETIGDCYVAVTGLPHARNDHAVVMAMFAKECLTRMSALVHRMEVILGPDTGDLSMRFGLHSGPVTAGVLRGDKSRFQLFGDSVNTAARIETTGERGKIHISHETAELLISAGRSKWVVPRRDLVTAKGKGVMRTYWLVKPDEGAKSAASISEDEGSDDEPSEYIPNLDRLGAMEEVDSKDAWGAAAVGVKNYNRLVEWNVDVLYQLLTKVLSKRQVQTNKTDNVVIELDLRFGFAALQAEGKKQSVALAAKSGVVDLRVKSQLRAYVTLIASMYRDHSFHNFEHASHVMLSITKLMSRITSPPTEEFIVSNGLEGDPDLLEDKVDKLLHHYTFGIASEPLLQFAVAFAALIHDVDHPGVPNAQLVKEDINLAKKYRQKSVAEKHSIRLAWERLMDSDYRELRSCLCPNQSDLKRFRNFVVNTVMATDIADKELSAKRKERWRHCFDEWPDEPTNEDVQRKATIVIEHLIQASDVAHTMQHFEVYKKWNERLFFEVYSAFDNGRAQNDPSEKWYEGEIGFFDFYIIPLAKKLGACGVFGVASDEYLNYAQENRQKWTKEGKALVETWLSLYNAKKSGMTIDEKAN